MRIFVQHLLNKRGFVWRIGVIEVITNSRVIRFLGMCHAFVQTCWFMHCILTSFSGLYWYCYNPSVLPPYRMECIRVCRAWWTGSGRLWEFPWKRNTTACCSEVDRNELTSDVADADVYVLQFWCHLFASHLLGLIGSLFSLLQFLASPVTGALSDHYGRRPLLLLTTVSKNVILDYQTCNDIDIAVLDPCWFNHI